MAARQHGARHRVRRIAHWARRHKWRVERMTHEIAAHLYEGWAAILMGPFRRWAEEVVPLFLSPGTSVRFLLSPPDEIRERAIAVLRETIALAKTLLVDEAVGIDVDLWSEVAESFEAAMLLWGERTWARITNLPRLVARVRQALDEGLGLEEAIRVGIRQTGARYYEMERLVRTELSTALNQGTYQAYVRAGVRALRWITARDSRVRGLDPHDRANHWDMHGAVTPIGTPFVTPRGHLLYYPGDRSLGAPPEEVVNCRCTIVPVFDEDG